MPADSELWIPPLLPKDQKKANRRQKYQGLVKRTGFPEKTLWDWLQLVSVLAIPVVIAAGTLWFTAQQSEISSQASDRQHKTDIQIAQDQQQESALQMYLDRMSDLLLNSKLRESQPGDEVRNVARSRTLTILPQLNGTRKGEIVRFLQESGLINQKNTVISLVRADLSGADLNFAILGNANLGDADLSNANLSSAELYNANLGGAVLDNANLYGAILDNANLYNISLYSVNLSHAYLQDANLGGAHLENTNLSSTTLRGVSFQYAHLRNVDLSNADLTGADLTDADLTGAIGTTTEQLNQAKSLQGATMPNGSKHP